MNYSDYQQDVFDYMAAGTGNRIVKAVAGSGKTTTIVHGLSGVRDCNALVVAFNTNIASELSKRVPEQHEARTFHSACLGALRRAEPALKVDGKKLQKLSRELAGEMNIKLGGRGHMAVNGSALVAKAKQMGVGAIVEDSEPLWKDLAEQYDLDSDHQSLFFARALLEKSIELTRRDLVIDFDDMLLHCLLDNIEMRKFDLIAVDEAQDLSPIQHALLSRMISPGGRLLAVGDPRQAIYAFRGADALSFANIQSSFACEELPLTISYRCAKAVVRHAQQIVHYIEAFEGAPEGEVQSGVRPDWRGLIPGEDVILCRNNAPLITLALSMIGAGIGVKIIGRDIAAGLKKLALRFVAPSCQRLRRDLDEWLDHETARLLNDNQEEKIQTLKDKHSCLIVVIDSLSPTATVDRLVEKLDSLFHDRNGVLELSTVHKAKGLEWERVFILRHDLLLPRRGAGATQLEQAENLRYVAYTRAKHALYLLHDSVVGVD